MQEDIKTDLQTFLSAIAQKSKQPLPWPTLDELEILLERSDRLFIYAAIAIWYIGAQDVDFRKRLAHITHLMPARMNMGVIDSLYNDIMRQAFFKLQPNEVSARCKTLSAVAFLLVPLSLEAITSLSGMDSLEAQVALAPFQSVIHVPTADTSPVTIFHTSFPNFIVDLSRCKEPFRLDQSKGHQSLAVQCLWCLNQTFKHYMTCSFTHKPNAIPEAPGILACTGHHILHTLLPAL